MFFFLCLASTREKRLITQHTYVFPTTLLFIRAMINSESSFQYGLLILFSRFHSICARQLSAGFRATTFFTPVARHALSGCCCDKIPHVATRDKENVCGFHFRTNRALRAYRYRLYIHAIQSACTCAWIYARINRQIALAFNDTFCARCATTASFSLTIRHMCDKEVFLLFLSFLFSSPRKYIYTRATKLCEENKTTRHALYIFLHLFSFIFSFILFPIFLFALYIFLHIYFPFFPARTL